MTEPLYIWMNRWEDFQTYQRKRGKPWAPPWIRVYLHLLDDPDYLRLTLVQRSLLHDLWLVFALSHTYLPLDIKMLNRRLQRSDKIATYERLNDTGWITLCSRTVLEQKRYLFRNGSSPEVEKEQEQEAEVNHPPLFTPTPEPAPEPVVNYDGDADIDFDSNGAGAGAAEIEKLGRAMQTRSWAFQ